MFKCLFRKFILVVTTGILLLSCNKSDTSTSSSYSVFDSLISIAYDTIRIDPNRGLKILKSSEKYISDSIDYWRAKSLYSHYYLTNGQPDSAIGILQHIIRFTNSVADNKEKDDFLLIAYNQLGNCYSQYNELDSAVFYFLKSLQYSHEKSKIENLINLADVNIWKGNYAEGTSYFIQALAISDSLNVPDSENFPVYAGLSQAYLIGMSDFEKSNYYFKKAEKYVDYRNNYDKIVFYNNRGTYHYFKGEYEDALTCFLKAKSLVGNTNASYFVNLLNTNLGDVYYRLHKPDSAKKCLDASYSYNKKAGDNSSLFYIATIRAALALEENKPELAGDILEDYPESKQIRAELLRIRYNILSKAYASKNDFRKAYDFQEKLRLIDDSLRSQKTANVINELEIRYKQDTTLLKKEIQIQKKEEEVKTLKATNTISIFIAFIALLTALLVYTIFKRKRDVNLLRYYETTSRLRLQNIRNRISPHFMFNMLNRQINLEKEKEKNSVIYELVSLLRKSLQMTEGVTVSLSEEIEFVESYLKLENGSSGHPLRVSWDLENNIDTAIWNIPAMLIQIPVENALKYAIRDDIQGELVITIKELNNSLYLEIRDNGPGYDPAKIAGNKGTGTGLKVLLSTINILNKRNKEKIIFKIINLKDSGSSGTAVQITIPKEFDFGLKSGNV